MADISGLSETDASNTSISGISMAEGCPPSNHNDAVRNLAGMMKRDWDKRGPTMTTGGSANAQTLTPAVAQTSLVRGDSIAFVAGFSNTGAMTLAISGLTATAVRLANAALAGGEIVAGQTYQVVYDGTAYQLVSPAANAASPYSGFKNALINGDFEIWQRGAQGSASIAQAASLTAMTADRWYLLTQTGQASVVSQQAGLTNGSRFACRVQRNSGQTGTGTTVFAQALTTDALIPLRGKPVTMSGWVSSGADWSPTTGNLRVIFFAGVGSEAKRGGGFSSEVTVISQTIALTAGSSATYFSFTSAAVLPTTVTQGEFHFEWTPVGTASTNDWVQFDEAQLEIGQATNFDRRHFAVELAECQRFYVKSFPIGTAPAQNAGINGSVSLIQAVGASTSTQSPFVALPVRMRVAPTWTLYNPSAANANPRNATVGADCSAFSQSTTDYIAYAVYTTAAGSAAGNLNIIHFQADAEV